MKVVQRYSYPDNLTINPNSFGIVSIRESSGDPNEVGPEFYILDSTRKIQALRYNQATEDFRLDSSEVLDLSSITNPLGNPINTWLFSSLNYTVDLTATRWYLTQKNTGNAAIVIDTGILQTVGQVSFLNFSSFPTFTEATDLSICATTQDQFNLLSGNKLISGNVIQQNTQSVFIKTSERLVGTWVDLSSENVKRSLTTSFTSTEQNEIAEYKGDSVIQEQINTYFANGLKKLKNTVNLPFNFIDDVLKICFDYKTQNYYLFTVQGIYEVDISYSLYELVETYQNSIPEDYRTSAFTQAENTVETSLKDAALKGIGSTGIYGRFLKKLDLASLSQSSRTFSSSFIDYSPFNPTQVFNRSERYCVTSGVNSYMEFILPSARSIEYIEIDYQILDDATPEDYFMEVSIVTENKDQVPVVHVEDLPKDTTRRVARISTFNLLPDLNYFITDQIKLTFSRRDIRIFNIEIYENGSELGSSWIGSSETTKKESFDQVLYINFNEDTNPYDNNTPYGHFKRYRQGYFDQTRWLQGKELSVLAPLTKIETNWITSLGGTDYQIQFPFQGQVASDFLLFEDDNAVDSGLLLREIAVTSKDFINNAVEIDSSLGIADLSKLYVTYIIITDITKKDIYPFDEDAVDAFDPLPNTNNALTPITQNPDNYRLFSLNGNKVEPLSVWINGRQHSQVEISSAAIQINENSYLVPSENVDTFFLAFKKIDSPYSLTLLERTTDYTFTEDLLVLSASLAPTEDLSVFFARESQTSSLYKYKELTPAPDGSRTLFSIDEFKPVLENTEILFSVDGGISTILRRGIDYQITGSKILFFTAPPNTATLHAYYATSYDLAFTEYVSVELSYLSGDFFRIPAPYALPDTDYTQNILVFEINNSNEPSVLLPSSFFINYSAITGTASIEIPGSSPTDRYIAIFQQRASAQPSILQTSFSLDKIVDRNYQYLRTNDNIFLTYDLASATADAFVSDVQITDNSTFLLNSVELTPVENTSEYPLEKIDETGIVFSVDENELVWVFRNGKLLVENYHYLRKPNSVSLLQQPSTNDYVAATKSSRLPRKRSFDQTMYSILDYRKVGMYDQVFYGEIIRNVIKGKTDQKGQVEFYYKPGTGEGIDQIKVTNTLNLESQILSITNDLREASAFDSTELKATQYIASLTPVTFIDPTPPSAPKFVQSKIQNNKIILNWETVIENELIPTASIVFRERPVVGYNTGSVIVQSGDLLDPRFTPFTISNSKIISFVEIDFDLYAVDFDGYIFKYDYINLVWTQIFNVVDLLPTIQPEPKFLKALEINGALILVTTLGNIYQISSLDTPSASLEYLKGRTTVEVIKDQNRLYLVGQDSWITCLDYSFAELNTMTFGSTIFSAATLIDKLVLGTTYGEVLLLDKDSYSIQERHSPSNYEVQFVSYVGGKLYCTNSTKESFTIEQDIKKLENGDIRQALQWENSIVFFDGKGNYLSFESPDIQVQIIQTKVQPYVEYYIVEKSVKDVDDYLSWVQVSENLEQTFYEEAITEQDKLLFFRVKAVDSLGRTSQPSEIQAVRLDQVTYPLSPQTPEITTIKTFFEKRNVINWKKVEKDLYGRTLLRPPGYKLYKTTQNDPYPRIIFADYSFRPTSYVTSFNVEDNNYLIDRRYGLVDNPIKNWMKWNTGRTSTCTYDEQLQILKTEQEPGIFITNNLQAVKYYPTAPKLLNFICWDIFRITKTGEVKVFYATSEDELVWSAYKEITHGSNIDQPVQFIKLKLELATGAQVSKIELDYWLEDVVFGTSQKKTMILEKDYFVPDNLEVVFSFPVIKNIDNILIRTLYSPEKEITLPVNITATIGTNLNVPTVEKTQKIFNPAEYYTDQKAVELNISLSKERASGNLIKLTFQRQPDTWLYIDEVEFYETVPIGYVSKTTYTDTEIDWQVDRYIKYYLSSFLPSNFGNEEINAC